MENASPPDKAAPQPAHIGLRGRGGRDKTVCIKKLECDN